jgi:hypothetical protein
MPFRGKLHATTHLSDIKRAPGAGPLDLVAAAALAAHVSAIVFST